MAEYLIRTDGGEWPAVHKTRLADVLIPPGSDCEAVEGHGDFQLRCGGGLLTFSGEEVGWQVIVENVNDADALIDVITRRIADEAQEPCTWVNLG